jgi:hypothetical protein
MYKAEAQKTATKITIRILKSRAKEFSEFRKELDALLKKHNVKKGK